MNQKKQKQINIVLSKIINWPQPQSLQSKFELSFYTKSEGALIISKIIDGKYIKQQKTMLLDSTLRISYTLGDEMVILRVSHRMGLGGLMVLGQFNISLMALSQKKQMKLCLNPSKGQYLIIQLQNENKRKNKLINQQEILRQLKKYEQKYGLQQRRSSKTKQFIKERQQFLQRHSNSSSRSNSGLSSRDRLIGLRRQSQNHNTNLYNNNRRQFYQQEENNQVDGNQYLSIQSSRQHLINSKINPYFSPNNINNYFSPYNNYSNQCYSNRLSQQKLITKDTKYNKRDMNNNNRDMNKNNNKRDNSFNNSEKTNSSSQKYLLLVNNLNVIPCDEYYQTRVKNIVKQNTKKTSTINQLQINTNKKKYHNIYTSKNTQNQIITKNLQSQQILKNQQNEDMYKDQQPQNDNMIIKLKQQFKRHSQYY